MTPHFASLQTSLKRRARGIARRGAGSDQMEATIAALEARVRELEEVDGTRRTHERPALWNVAPGPTFGAPSTASELLGDNAAAVERMRSCLAWFAHMRAEVDLTRLGPEELLRRLHADRLPLPAPVDREHYFATDDVAYWLSGLADYLLLADLAEERGRPLAAGQRVLDFGCASGRTLRHFLVQGPELDLHGTDLGVRNVDWMRQHLPAGICAHQATILPRLPLEDASVDVLFAGSVLTHVDPRLEEATLLELRRVLRPGGFALITIHPERDWAALCSGEDHWVASLIHGAPHRLDPLGQPVTRGLLRDHAAAMPAGRVVLVNLTGDVNHTNVVHSDAWIRERWGRHFTVEQVVECAHGTAQDGLVLSR